MAKRIGLKAKAYFLSTGTRATWGAADANGMAAGPAPDNLTEMTNVRDLTLNLSTGEADVTTRGGNGWKLTMETLKDGSVEFEMLWDPADAVFAAIFKAWLNNGSIAMAILDGPSATVGSQGLWADFQVTNISRKEPLTEAMTASVAIKPTASAVAPEWAIVTA